MGFFDKLKQKGRGIVTAAPPAEGVAPATEDEVRERLLAIEGKGIQTAVDGDQITVAWTAKVAAAGPGAAGYEHLYRAVRVALDAPETTATGICLKATTEAEVSLSGALTGSLDWERGQHIGSETHHVIAWLGPHHTEGGADERGYEFSWSDLREQVIDAVTGAGWTYKPKRI